MKDSVMHLGSIVKKYIIGKRNGMQTPVSAAKGLVTN